MPVKKTARVEYYDEAWGGWRPITAFGDSPRATWSEAVARRKARELSSQGRTAFRAVTMERESTAEGVVTYRRGERVS